MQPTIDYYIERKSLRKYCHLGCCNIITLQHVIDSEEDGFNFGMSFSKCLLPKDNKHCEKCKYNQQNSPK